MELQIEIVPSLAEVDAAEWNALCAPNDPFMEHGFLRLLEESRSVGPAESGWLPRHVLVKREGKLLAAMPLYLKHHSYGEFIFDFGWAQAALRAGLPYYPKLISAAPFTPAGGRRLLLRAEDEAALTPVLIAAAREVALREQASSVHVLFCSEQESVQLQELGMHARHSTQYHFQNEGYHSFADFMAALRNSSRKAVRKERERAQSYGLNLTMRAFSELPAPDVAAMWTFYRSTIANHGSEAYLRRGFFERLGTTPYAYAAMAHDGSEPVAGALFFYKGTSLFGRYWGAVKDLPMLHFELCYYLPMEWALERGMQRFEAGAQGEHKIKRGFLPNTCFSSHWAAHPGLDKAIGDFVIQEQTYVAREQEILAGSTPFKRSSSSSSSSSSE
ncbi:MAG: N-acetyltransferase [Myxococcaceae bacterium]|nr:N-acetyltransferase [Myxococcaceae bacterium]